MTCLRGADITDKWYIQHPGRKRQCDMATKIVLMLLKMYRAFWEAFQRLSHLCLRHQPACRTWGHPSLLQLLHKGTESQLNKEKWQKNNATRIKEVSPPKPELDGFLWISEEICIWIYTLQCQQNSRLYYSLRIPTVFLLLKPQNHLSCSLLCSLSLRFSFNGPLSSKTPKSVPLGHLVCNLLIKHLSISFRIKHGFLRKSQSCWKSW